MIIEPVRNLRGRFTVPGDKSISHRAVMLGSLADGVTEISGFLNAADCLSSIECFSKLGIKTERNGDFLRVHGKGLNGLTPPTGVLYTGNSGTTTRLLCGILAGQNFDSIIDGDEMIRRRPMQRVTSPLGEMGALITARDGNYCPLQIKKSSLHGIDYTLPVASAQIKSAFLFAGLYASGKTVIREKELSRDHTELMMKRFGVSLSVDDKVITLSPVDALKACEINVPGDISSAAFFIVAALITKGSEITIENVGLNPRRTGILDALLQMGADIEISDLQESTELCGTITARSSKLHGAIIGGSIIPRMIDEIPVLAVAAACAEGQTVIKDASELLYKESNRILTTATELKKAGADVLPTDDGFIINGGSLHGTLFDSHNDHRIAMAMAVASLAADSPSDILRAECVDISYPEFFETLKQLVSGKSYPSYAELVKQVPIVKDTLEKSDRRNIFIVGFMGSGKTRTGARLADLLGYSFIDTDSVIEEREKTVISDIFATHGEVYFRKLEAETIASLSAFTECVIATGGGAVLDPLNVKQMKRHGKLVFLDAPFEKILQNTEGDQSRPLISAKAKDDILTLFEKRYPLYKNVADIVVNATGMDTDAIIMRLLNQLL